VIDFSGRCTAVLARLEAACQKIHSSVLEAWASAGMGKGALAP